MISTPPNRPNNQERPVISPRLRSAELESSVIPPPLRPAKLERPVFPPHLSPAKQERPVIPPPHRPTKLERSAVSKPVNTAYQKIRICDLSKRSCVDKLVPKHIEIEKAMPDGCVFETIKVRNPNYSDDVIKLITCPGKPSKKVTGPPPPRIKRAGPPPKT